MRHHVTMLEWLLLKRQEITNVKEDVEKGKRWYTVSGTADWCSHYGKQQKFVAVSCELCWDS